MNDSGAEPMVTCKPLEWNIESAYGKVVEWHDSLLAFGISFDPDDAQDDGAKPYRAYWGEGDPEWFATEAEAKAWCQSEADDFIREHALVLHARNPAFVGEWHARAVALGYDGVANMLASVEQGEAPQHIAEVLARAAKTSSPQPAIVSNERMAELAVEWWMAEFKDMAPATASLVWNFALALGNKLADAEKKYGYTDGWRNKDWMDECRQRLTEHVGKGDPRDVAAYCAFLWYHGERTELPATKPEPLTATSPLQKGAAP